MEKSELKNNFQYFCTSFFCVIANVNIIGGDVVFDKLENIKGFKRSLTSGERGNELELKYLQVDLVAGILPI